ncbi:MAG: hypothetical protein AAF581_17660 [Planctomycetota bacterium]
MRFIASTLSLALVSVASGCASLPPDSNRMSPEMAPTPYSAAELRAGCPDGRVVRLQGTAPGSKTPTTDFHFTDGDAEGVTVSGERTTWEELQSHASFPEESVTITTDSRMIPDGEYECWLYTVRTTDGDDNRIERRMWFARALPGPPIDMEIDINDQPFFSMTMIQTK